MTRDPCNPWVPHEQPDRPFDAWTWLHDCDVCIAALVREAQLRPRLLLCLKTNADRIVVTAEYLAEVMAADKKAETLCYVRDDWVREIFVPVNGYLPEPHRWWSLTLAECERARGKTLKGRRKATRERPRRQPTRPADNVGLAR